jgi:hypothetical protein
LTSPSVPIQVIWYTSTALQAVLLCRLCAVDLWRNYRWFTAFLAVLVAESISLALVRGYIPKSYGEVWIATRITALVFEIAACVEIFSRWSGNFEGIGIFGRRLFGVLLVGALLAVAFTLPADATRTGWVFAYQITAVTNRGVHLWLALFIALTMIFFHYFGGGVAPNLRRHTFAMLMFLTGTGLSYFSGTIAHKLALLDALLPAVALASFAVWLGAFRRNQEEKPAAEFTPEELAEYEAAEELNQRLLRFGERVTVRGVLGIK